MLNPYRFDPRSDYEPICGHVGRGGLPTPILDLVSDDSVGGATVTSLTCRASGLVFTPQGGAGPGKDTVTIAPHTIVAFTTATAPLGNLAASSVCQYLTGVQPYTCVFYVRMINIAGTRTLGGVNIDVGNSRLNWKTIGASPAANLRNVRANSGADVNYDDTGNTLDLSPTKGFLCWVFDGTTTTWYRNLTSLGSQATPQSVGAGANRLFWCATTSGASTNTSQLRWRIYKKALTIGQLTAVQAQMAY